MTNRILVPIDGSPRSGRAVRAAIRLARGNRASLALFNAMPTCQPPMYAEGYAIDWPPPDVFLRHSAAASKKVLDRAKRQAAKQKVAATLLQARSDSPATAILAAARKVRAGMIVMASHGRTGLDKLLLGSETQKVLAKTKLPVLVVR